MTRQDILVDLLLAEHSRMRHVLTALEAGKPEALVEAFNELGAPIARIELRQADDGRLYWRPQPNDLMQAMWFQLGQFATSGAKLARCQHCGKPFVVGAHTGRRSTALYCCNAHKVAAFKERHGLR